MQREGPERESIQPASALSVPRFAGKAPTAQAEYCLNLRHKAAGCTRCATACPADAITLDGGRPTLDSESCIRCGICLHACPTDVYEQPAAAEGTLLQSVAMLPEQPIALVCPLHPTPEQSHAPVEVIVRHSRCLAALSAADLLAISNHGQRELWLDDSPCTACPIGAAHATLLNTVATTNALLDLADVVPNVYTCTQNSERLVSIATRRPWVDGARPKISRRGLFAALRQSAQQMVERAIDRESSATPAASIQPRPVEQRLPQRLPLSRQRLLQAMAHLLPVAEKRIATTYLPLAAVHIDATTCSACNLCARFCPTGALQFTAASGEFQLDFLPLTCLDCGICAHACPEDAIQFADQLSTATLSNTNPQNLLQSQLTHCATCGAATAKRLADRGASLCYACRHGAGTVTPLVDGAGLMADLLRRARLVQTE